MARTPAQRGKGGQWLLESRLARGYTTQARARAEIARLTGWKIPQSQYAEWESGRRAIGEANLERLQAFYGQLPEAEPTTAGGDQAAVIAALDRQTKAIERQASAMEQLCSLLALTLNQSQEARDAAAIGREEMMEAVGRIQGTLDRASRPAGGSDESPADVRRARP